MLTGEVGKAMVEAAAAELAGDQADQLELLPATRFEPGSEAHNELVAGVARARAGRPPGARNIATRDMVAFVRRTIGDPFLESARVLLHTPATLAAELGCSKVEAFDRIERIRSDLRPFMYARLAPTDANGAAVVPAFQMFFGAGRRSPDAGADRPPWIEDFEANGALSHDGQSHVEANPLQLQAKP